MASGEQIHDRPIAIAPLPTSQDANGDVNPPTMLYACQACANRKIKCDKVSPICSSCRKGRIDCIYQAPPPRRRKRKLSGDGSDRLARYERILREHGLLPQDDDTSLATETPSQEPASLRFLEPEGARTGKLLASQGKTRYINSSLWRDFGAEEMDQMSEDDEEDLAALSADPLTGAFMGYQMRLHQYHPTHAEAMLLWKTHVENVEPICKVLHIPTVSRMVETVSQQPEAASKTEEALLFAIYHFAIFSMTEEDCQITFGHTRAALMQTYHFAARQALVNASFLKTSELSLLQSLVLFLIPCRYSYDAQTYWILTGVAIRISQRMGLHRDGEKLGLPPFDVQMRRRIFYQLIPLDGIASRVSGTGIAVNTWDTEQPLNINDDDIWPDMTEMPTEKKGATDMIFCLARGCIGKYFAKPGNSIFKDYIEAESTIAQAESEVEEQYIRYCDVINPLHFLTICQARSAITAMRLRVRMPKIRDQTATNAERKEIFQFAQKIIDTDTTACKNTSLRPYWWHMRSFFAWGSWDSLILVLTTLRRGDLLTALETDAAWSKVECVYNNRADLMESKRALHIAVGRLAVKAWDASPSRTSLMEPAFITTLRSKHEVRRRSRLERQASTATSFDQRTDPTPLTGPSTDPSPSSDANALFASLSGDMSVQIGNDFSVDNADWMFWDQMIQDYQTQGYQPTQAFAQ